MSLRNFIISLVPAFAITAHAAGQPAAFLKTYNTGHIGFAIREVAGNQYVVGGATDFYFNYHWMVMSPFNTTNIHLFKTDDRGDLLWESVFGNPNSRTMARWLEPTQDGGYILTGSDSRDEIWPPDSNDIVLVKAAANGTISWSRKFDSGKDDLGFCVRQTFDGGFIVSGFHDDTPVSVLGNTHAVLVKTDALGNIQWERRYGLAVRDFVTKEAFPFYVYQTADSGYIVTGTTLGTHAADLYVFRTDVGGNLLWANAYVHDNSVLRLSLGLDIIETSTGDLVIAGSLDKDRNNNETNYPYIVKLGASGNLLDARFYETNPLLSFQSGFSSVYETADSGFIFTGMGGYAGFGDQAQLLKTDRDFNMEWSRVYTWDGMATMGARSGRPSSDGHYLFTGKKQFDGTVIMKTNSDGLIPCKNPDALIESAPAILVMSLNPATGPALASFPFPLAWQTPLPDTNIACNPVTLPVELLHFSGRPMTDGRVWLEWKTGSEVNNDYFVIEKSTDGIRFEPAGTVKGHGHSVIQRTYSFTDRATPGVELLYYRLRQIDFDGRNRIYGTIPVKLLRATPAIRGIYTDRAHGVIRVTLNTAVSGRVDYTIMDPTGQVLSGSTILNEAGPGILEIPAPGWPQGIYFLRLYLGDHSFTGKLIY